MKSLLEYIIEQAVGNLGITIEEFNSFIDDYYNNVDYQDTVLWKKLRDRDLSDSKIDVIIKYIGNTLDQLSDMKVDIDDNVARFIYDKICNTPESILGKLIAGGSNGAVIDMGDKVIKFHYNKDGKSDSNRFYKYCLKNSFRYFPKVYRIGKGYVIMEKLDTKSPKIDKFFRILDGDVITTTNRKISLYYAIKDNIVDVSNLSKDQLEVKNWLEAVGRELWQNNILDEGDYGDLSENNVGVRDNKDLVFFDI